MRPEGYTQKHYSLQIGVLSVFHSMGLAVPGYLEHQLSIHLCLAGQRQIGHISPHTFRPCLPIPSFLSSAGKREVCDRFDTRRDPLYMAIPSRPPYLYLCCNNCYSTIPSETPTAKDRCNVLDAMFL